ncbi:hypothetical protein J53TS2_00640 [Paenibacillus sp. J53TS2]|uniref:hypothetical protein n=1 Tax=Paenibacillus sp. J53TS2 TaxID=2807197 RepID=UPI001AFCFB7D|nr:hypothetical protein [Paenibacillus sp. J53TS2]GIP46473.1 hypothetical protein J53TS2_00640 [Paenibacillus sp. J53TS2]
MNYEEFYRREREIQEYHQLLKRPGGPQCFAVRGVSERPRKVRTRMGSFGKVLRSFFQMFQ